jgi:hypothetical protein
VGHVHPEYNGREVLFSKNCGHPRRQGRVEASHLCTKPKSALQSDYSTEHDRTRKQYLVQITTRDSTDS